MPNGPYKKSTYNSTKHAEQQDVTYIQIKLCVRFLCFIFLVFILDFLKWLLPEMLSYHLGVVNDFHWVC